MPTGRLISFEGIDGSGKSTQAKLLFERLRQTGRNSALFREPGGTVLGEQVRKFLLEQHDSMGSMAELMLFAAARAELVRQIVKPALQGGCIVILDRFIDSTTAYQGYGRGIDHQLIDTINTAATQGITPDATFLFDISPEEGLNRHQRTHDRMEKEGIAFMAKVRQGYLSTVRKASGRIVVFDGTIEVAGLAKMVWERVNQLV